MHVQVFDSAGYSPERDYGPRTVLWAIDGMTQTPICINLVGWPTEAYLELPKTARGRAVNWKATTGPDFMIKKKIIDTISSAITNPSLASIELVDQYKMFGYHANKHDYLHVKCEKREDLDAAIKSSEKELANMFSGATPIWRETEIDATTKTFARLNWKRSGWFKIPDKYTYIEEPLLKVNVSTVPATSDATAVTATAATAAVRLAWRCPLSKSRPTLHVYLHWRDLIPVDAADLPRKCKASALILYFDIETMRGVLKGFPNALIPSDVIYLCSIVLSYVGSGKVRKICICLGRPKTPVECDIELVCVASEAELLEKFTEIIVETNPDVISGFNIHRFDLKYIEERVASMGRVLGDISRLPGKESQLDFLRGPRGIRYTNIKCPGRIVIDLYVYLVTNTSRREVGSFSLKSVAKYYLRADALQKIDLSYDDQFLMYFKYLLGYPEGPSDLYQLVNYCVQDSAILPALFDNRGVWNTLVQASNILGATMQTVAVAGQVERLTPFLYARVKSRETVMEVNPEKIKYKFEGGYVHLSRPGLHFNLVIGDFASLYPSIMIWFNTCWSTRVAEDETVEFKNEHSSSDYHVTNASYSIPQGSAATRANDDDYDMDDDPVDDPASVNEPDEAEANDLSDDSDSETQETMGVLNTKDTASIIRKGKAAMAKPENTNTRNVDIMWVRPNVKMGILPEAVKILLDERARVRKVVMKELKANLDALDPANHEEIAHLEQLIDDADKQQSALKVAANSIYGLMGAVSNYGDPFVGMSITAEGRRLIQLSTDKIIEKAPSARRHVYSDTDSSMIVDDGFKEMHIRPLAETLSFKIEDCGIDPMSLFEEARITITELFATWCKERSEMERHCVIPAISQRCIELCSIPDKSGIYGKPMKFEFEAFVIVGLWFKKKFYIARVLDEEGHVKLKQRGIPLRRGDYPQIMKKVYGEACFALLDGKSIDSVVRNVFVNVRQILVGPTLTFEECMTSHDFKSITEFKSSSCKMAVMARNAEKMGIPIAEYSRVDCIMAESHEEGLARNSIMVNKQGKSEHAVTRDMTNVVPVQPDRDHYFSICVSHIDTLLKCAAGGKSDMWYFLDRRRVAGLGVTPEMARTPLHVAHRKCPTCSVGMSHWIRPASTLAGPDGIRMGPLLLTYGCATCKTIPTGVQSPASLSIFTWKYDEPMISFSRIYTKMLAENPDAPLTQIRHAALNFADIALSHIYPS